MKPMLHKREAMAAEGGEFHTTVVKINRCATVVKGGRRFSFSALIVVGNGDGLVGWGFGKAKEVPRAVEKAEKDARKQLVRVAREAGSIPHEVWGRFGAARVILIPAAPGTGVIAGSAVRGVVELAGIKNILSKSFGSTNPINLVKATMEGLKNLKTAEDIEVLRGVEIREHKPEHETAGAGAAGASQAS